MSSVQNTAMKYLHKKASALSIQFPNYEILMQLEQSLKETFRQIMKQQSICYSTRQQHNDSQACVWWMSAWVISCYHASPWQLHYPQSTHYLFPLRVASLPANTSLNCRGSQRAHTVSFSISHLLFLFYFKLIGYV